MDCPNCIYSTTDDTVKCCITCSLYYTPIHKLIKFIS